MIEEKQTILEDDDGRTVAPMNVDGMPWYIPKERRTTTSNDVRQENLTSAEKRRMLTGVMGAVFLITAVFGAVFLLFILFCTNVWFK